MNVVAVQALLASRLVGLKILTGISLNRMKRETEAQLAPLCQMGNVGGGSASHPTSWLVGLSHGQSIGLG